MSEQRSLGAAPIFQRPLHHLGRRGSPGCLSGYPCVVHTPEAPEQLSGKQADGQEEN
jgi:hypothetical protein